MKTILNKIKDVLIRYNPIVFTKLLKLLIDDVKLLQDNNIYLDKKIRELNKYIINLTNNKEL